MADDSATLDHVLRSEPPWRRAGLRTECGISADGRPVITRDEFLAKVKSQGRQRSAITTCMTCWNTAGTWKAWDEDPVSCIGRETYNRRMRPDNETEDPFARELRAIAALIDAHREEFDGYIEGLDDVADLGQRRAKRARDERAR